MTYQFDADTAVVEVEPGVFRGNVHDRWNVGPVPNGGYLLAMAARAIGAKLPGRELRTITAHYLRPARCAPLEIEVEPVKEGRTYSTAMARLIQEIAEPDAAVAKREHARVLATFASPDARPGPEHVRGTPPELPPVEECLRGPMTDAVAITHRFDTRYAPETGGFFAGNLSGRAELRAWVRFADGREPDVDALPLIADALPPPILNVTTFRWVPTIELTVHVRARPAPGWLRCKFESRFVFGGYLEADGEIWDSAGNMVAQSRQLMSAGGE